MSAEVAEDTRQSMAQCVQLVEAPGDSCRVDGRGVRDLKTVKGRHTAAHCTGHTNWKKTAAGTEQLMLWLYCRSITVPAPKSAHTICARYQHSLNM